MLNNIRNAIKINIRLTLLPENLSFYIINPQINSKIPVQNFELKMFAKKYVSTGFTIIG
jgi:hypothetical protein